MVVDDSIVARTMLTRGLSSHPQIEVVGAGFSARDAKNKIQQLRPDVMTLDVEMPGMSGIDFLKTLLPEYPLPVILVSSLNLRVFDALAAGAVDFVRKPDVQESKEGFITNLTQKILVASMARPRSAPLRSPSIAVDTPSLGGGLALDRVLVGLGAPKQELWMAQNGPATGAKFMIGLGGALDVFAGVTQRAPERWQKMGMEWCYRLIHDPKRISRMAKLPLVLVQAAGQRVRGK